MSTPRLRDPIPVPTDFEIEGPFYRRVGIVLRVVQIVLAFLVFGGLPFLAGFFGRLAGQF